MHDLNHTTPEVRVFAGDHALRQLPRELERLGARRAVVVCGRSIADHTGVLDRIVEQAGGRVVGVADLVRAHSPAVAVRATADRLREAGADAVLAVGGGSAVVTARAATILVAEGKPLRDLCTRRDDRGELVSPRLLAPKMPNIVIPTTPTTAYAKAGSAVHDDESGDRLALFDPKTRAKAILIDPVLAGTAPRRLVEGASLNALSIAVDALLSHVDDPLARALSAEALRLLAIWLPRLAVADDQSPVRMRLMVAALLSGQGSDYLGGGLTQVLGHALGPRSAASNGHVEAVLLPHTLNVGLSETASRVRELAPLLGWADPTAAGAVAALAALLGSVGVPSRLRDLGVVEADLDGVVVDAQQDWTLRQLPRQVDRAQLRALLGAAW